MSFQLNKSQIKFCAENGTTTYKAKFELSIKIQKVVLDLKSSQINFMEVNSSQLLINFGDRLIRLDSNGEIVLYRCANQNVATSLLKQFFEIKTQNWFA